VTIEDGVCPVRGEDRIMFDNGKGRLIQRTDIVFSSCRYAGEFDGGLEDEQVNQDLEGEGVGSGKKSELRNEKYEIVRFFEWISRQYLRHLEMYGMSFENE